MNAKKTLALATSATLLTLAGCYAVPVSPGGEVVIVQPAPAYPVAQPVRPAYVWPALLHARLYPSNGAATETGMLTGTVTNMQTGKGRFQLHYRDEVLVGEATRVAGYDRRGIANAWGTGGTYMSCDYQMNSPSQGTGECTLSNGAKYRVHVGS